MQKPRTSQCDDPGSSIGSAGSRSCLLTAAQTGISEARERVGWISGKRNPLLRRVSDGALRHVFSATYRELKFRIATLVEYALRFASLALFVNYTVIE